MSKLILFHCPLNSVVMVFSTVKYSFIMRIKYHYIFGLLILSSLTSNIASSSQSISPFKNISRLKQPENFIASFKLNTYTSPSGFSIQHPPGWYIDDSGLNEQRRVTIQNFPFKESGSGAFKLEEIKTEVFYLSKSLETVTQEMLDNRRDSSILKVGKTNINGREYIRIWAGFGNTENIYSLVRYRNNKTFIVASYTGGLNQNKIDLIQKMHWSFKIIE